MRYNDPTLSLVPTDLTRLRDEPAPIDAPDGRFVALVLEFTLPPSSYATMLLRELTKQPTNLAHQLTLNTNSLGASEASAPPALAGVQSHPSAIGSEAIETSAADPAVGQTAE